MRISRALTLGAVLGLALLTTGAKEATDKGPAAPTSSQQEAEVVGVVIDPSSRQPVVLLQGKRDGRNLAMVIGQFEANGIAIPLQGVSPPRPLTHDLILTLLGGLGTSLRRIVITDLRDDVYYAQLHLDGPAGVLQVDSRPSDAIALALRAKVPILVEDRVFEKAERRQPRPGPSPHF